MKTGLSHVLAMLLVAATATGASAASKAEERQAPIVLEKSGGFIIGGKTNQNPNNPNQHFSCDHGYVEYFTPANPRKTSLVMWHSSSAQVWQNNWSGGEGYKDMFLRRNYPVFIWDGPRVGRANWSCEPNVYSRRPPDEQNFTSWNFGPSFKNWWPDVQFPTQDEKAWATATASRYEEFDFLKNIQLETDAAAIAADSGRLGDRIVYLTNSAGGLRAMVTTSKTTGNNIAGIVTYESIGYVFPIGDPESPKEFCTDPNACAFGPIGIPLEDFKKLAKVKAIQFVWGDHRSDPKVPTYQYVEQSRLAAKLINKYGGNAEVLMLGDDAGIKGATHIPFADLSNDRVAALLDAFLKKNKLDEYVSSKPNGHWVWGK